MTHLLNSKSSVALTPTAAGHAGERWRTAVTVLLQPRVLLPLLVLIGVALRLWLVLIYPIDPRFSNADDGDYYRRALRLAVTGSYVDDAWLIRPPGHVFFFAAWLWLALQVGLPEYGVLFVQLAQIGVSALTVLLGYGIARRMFRSQAAGLLFAAFLSLWFPFIEMPAVLFSELLYLFLFLLHVWLLCLFDATDRKRYLALSGLALGAAALTRSPALYSLAFVAIWLLFRRPTAGQHPIALWRIPLARDWWFIIKRLLLVTACCLAVVLPWTARNYVLYHHFIPVDTLGQINLWLDLDRVSDRDRNIATLRELPQSERHVYALEQARKLLAADPLRMFREAWPTFRHIWKAQYVEDYYVKQSFFTRPLREAAPIGLAGDVLWFVFTLAGLMGIVSRPREGWHHRLFFLAWIGYSLATVIVFHVEPRYLLPLWTLIGLYGAGWLATWRTTDAPLSQNRLLRNLPRVLQLSVAVAFLLLFFTYRDYPAIIQRGMARQRAMVAGEQSYLANQYVTAEQSFRAALEVQPDFVDGQVDLALSLAAQGRSDEALALLKDRGSRRSDTLRGSLLRSAGEEKQARELLTRMEETAGEDLQTWAMTWLRPPTTSDLTVGDGLDLGYVDGFAAGEEDANGSYRWLEGHGTIMLPLSRPLAEGDTVLLRLVSGRESDVPLTVQVNGGEPQTIPVSGLGWRTYRIPVPPEAAGQETLTLTLQAPTFIPARTNPASDDARTLSLMVGGARLQ